MRRPSQNAGVEVFIVGNSGLFQLDENLDTAWKKMLAQFYGIPYTDGQSFQTEAAIRV